MATDFSGADPLINDRWKARFRAARMTLPSWAVHRPERCLFVSNASGTFELYRWDRTTGETAQVTSRPTGTTMGALDPEGESIWWFDDAAGNEFGVWRRRGFFDDADAVEAVPGLAASYPSGLALGDDGLAVVGRSTDEGASIYVARPGAEPVSIYTHAQDAGVGSLSRDGDLVAIEHSEHGDSRHVALRVLRVSDGTTVADLWDGPGLGLEAVGFAPIAGDTRLIVRHERLGRWTPFIWDVVAGTSRDLRIDLPGDVSAQWFADASALLIGHAFQARSSLYRYDLATDALTALDVPAGSVAGATARPDGVVEFLWSSGAEPPAVRSSEGQVVIRPPGAVAPASVPVEDAWVDGIAGPIHALVSRPVDVAQPLPTVFLVHGGPGSHDEDAFSPVVAAWVDAGFAVVRVNYRGSTGYGTTWRDAIEHRVGLTELEDIDAVRSWAVSTGLADASRLVLAGGSWGGYLTLLGIGMAPQAWSVGLAAVPVADYFAAYEDEMEGLRAFDRALFGGTPDEVPERYRQSSPLTYVDDVVAPVLVLAGANDARCPIRQIDNYLDRLSTRDAVFEVYRFEAGHGSLVVEERIRQTEAQLDFALRHLELGMADIDEQGRPEPPVAGDEVATLLGFLDYQRATLAWKCSGLDAGGLNAKVGVSSMTLGGILKHMAYVESDWFSSDLFGRDKQPPWDTVDWKADPDWEWHSAADDTPEQLFAIWNIAVDQSRALATTAFAHGGLGQLAQRKWPDGRAPSLRWILVHMIEEYARHNGHADLLRESVDGATGE